MLIKKPLKDCLKKININSVFTFPCFLFSVCGNEPGWYICSHAPELQRSAHWHLGVLHLPSLVSSCGREVAGMNAFRRDSTVNNGCSIISVCVY